MPTLIAEAKEHCAEPIEEFKAKFEEVAEDARKKAKVVMRHTREAAEDLKHETELKLKKHPITAVGTAFGIGFVSGALALWFAKRR
jgi:ElaB/YqjD/DUF883 family membrane-anchored ribosome-binding protein